MNTFERWRRECGQAQYTLLYLPAPPTNTDSLPDRWVTYSLEAIQLSDFLNIDYGFILTDEGIQVEEISLTEGEYEEVCDNFDVRVIT